MRPALMVVGAHPDDEALLAGGLLADAAADRQPGVVVSLTRGDAGPVADPELLAGRPLGDVRAAELDEAARALGAAHVRCWRRGDGMLRWIPRSTIARQLARLIAQLNPEAIVTFGPDGLYGHPDHIATGQIVERAVAEHATVKGRRPAVFHGAWPKARTHTLVAAAAKGRRDWWGLEPDAFGLTEAEMSGAIELRVSPSAARARMQALRAHRTQLGPMHPLAQVTDEQAHALLGSDWLRLIGRGTEAGWLERRFDHAARAANPHAAARRQPACRRPARG
jgi:N-acetyl-1-D-myo-inositol-2-amino-2-deoxy-alpha-D-glucopyranoside deacetylase